MYLNTSKWISGIKWVLRAFVLPGITARVFSGTLMGIYRRQYLTGRQGTAKHSKQDHRKAKSLLKSIFFSPPGQSVLWNRTIRKPENDPLFLHNAPRKQMDLFKEVLVKSNSTLHGIAPLSRVESVHNTHHESRYLGSQVRLILWNRPFNRWSKGRNSVKLGQCSKTFNFFPSWKTDISLPWLPAWFWYWYWVNCEYSHQYSDLPSPWHGRFEGCEFLRGIQYMQYRVPELKLSLWSWACPVISSQERCDASKGNVGYAWKKSSLNEYKYIH